MSVESAPAMPDVADRSIRWGRVLPVFALAVAIVTVCGVLGAWQWSRASEQGEVRQPLPPAAIGDVAEPATTLAYELGRAVWADGSFADTDVALVHGRMVDGEPAVLVVRAFIVDAEATGTGEPATVPVVMGWLSPTDVADFDASAPSQSMVEGHLRSGEGAAPVPDPHTALPDGAFWADRLSPAVFAQQWPAPLYSALLTAAEPEDGLQALPEPEAERKLDFRSLAYAIEWWLFGGFFAFIALRWIRDNGRSAPASSTETRADNPGGSS